MEHQPDTDNPADAAAAAPVVTSPTTSTPATPAVDAGRQTRRRRTRRLVSLGLLVVYLLVVMFGGVVDRLILFPETDPMSVPGATRVEVPVPSRPPVEAFVLPSRVPAGTDPAAYVVTFNGNADRAECAVFAAEADAHRRPVEVWAVNYPGYGGSPGPARLAGIPPAALAAYDAVAAKAGVKPIVVTGVSLGTAAALHVARHRPVAGLILTNPPPLRQLILRHHGWWNAWVLAGPGSLAVPAELGSIDNAAGARCPAVFVSADADEVVPPRFHQMVIDAYAGPKRVVRLPEARHNDPPSGPAAAEVHDAVEWLWATAGVPAAPATSRPAAPGPIPFP
jgi:pimeloyl-ACP methyl ester carboxylesterase